MFTIGPTVHRTLFTNLIAKLQRRPLLVNEWRAKSGLGRSQAFGIAKQRTNQYAGAGHNYRRMDLFEELLDLAQRILPPEYKWDAITLNQNYQTTAHKDKGNRGISAIIGFGSYEGGELVIEDTPVDILHRVVFFNGSELTHYTKPFKGERFSMVFYRVDRDFESIPQWDILTHEKQTFLSETLDGITIIYNKKGEKVHDETGEWKPKMQRRPTLRILKEITSSSQQTTPPPASPNTHEPLSDPVYS